jgi:uncharacterized protein
LQSANDLGWILPAFAIVNTSVPLWSTQVNGAVFAVFLTLAATEVILFLGEFTGHNDLGRIGGIVGVITAAVARYTSDAGAINGMKGRPVLPVGGPLGGRPGNPLPRVDQSAAIAAWTCRATAAPCRRRHR